jgi:AP-2 complex subunit alpha
VETVSYSSPALATVEHQTILVSCYAKLANLYEEYRPLVAPVFARCTNRC